MKIKIALIQFSTLTAAYAVIDLAFCRLVNWGGNFLIAAAASGVTLLIAVLTDARADG